MRCYRHEAVMFPPTDCLECVRDTYGKHSEEYKKARARVLSKTALLRAARNDTRRG